MHFDAFFVVVKVCTVHTHSLEKADAEDLLTFQFSLKKMKKAEKK